LCINPLSLCESILESPQHCCLLIIIRAAREECRESLTLSTVSTRDRSTNDWSAAVLHEAHHQILTLSPREHPRTFSSAFEEWLKGMRMAWSPTSSSMDGCGAVLVGPTVQRAGSMGIHVSTTYSSRGRCNIAGPLSIIIVEHVSWNDTLL
jgi:hypothetical protein